MIPLSVEERIWSRTDRSGGPDACWLWSGAFGGTGTASIQIGKRNFPVRRVLYELAYGPLDKSIHIRSTCQDRRCINPNHIYLKPPLAPAQRFWSFVKTGPGCWEWTGRRMRHRGGYGSFQLARGVPVPAHRFSYELAYGPVPEGLHVCHRCDNPPCVRPDHLFAATNMENRHDMMRKGRHPFLKAHHIRPSQEPGEEKEKGDAL